MLLLYIWSILFVICAWLSHKKCHIEPSICRKFDDEIHVYSSKTRSTMSTLPPGGQMHNNIICILLWTAPNCYIICTPRTITSHFEESPSNACTCPLKFYTCSIFLVPYQMCVHGHARLSGNDLSETWLSSFSHVCQMTEMECILCVKLWEWKVTQNVWHCWNLSHGGDRCNKQRLQWLVMET